MDAVWGTVWPAVPASASRLSFIGQAMWPMRATIKAHSAHHPPDGVPVHSSLAPTEMKHHPLLNCPITCTLLIASFTASRRSSLSAAASAYKEFVTSLSE